MLDSLRSLSDNFREYFQFILDILDYNKWLILIIILAIILRFYFFIGLNWSDDFEYAEYAYKIANGNLYLGNDLPALRIMMIYPIAFFYKIFGINDFSLVIYPFLLSIGSIFLTYSLGKMLFNKKVGLLSAFFLSIFPLNILYSTWALPDVPIAFFSALSVLLFLKAQKIEKSNVNLNFNRKSLFLLSGFLIGVSYLHKVSGALVILFLILYMLYKIYKNRKIDFDYAFVFFGFVFILVAEGLFYYLNNGDFFTRYNVITNYYLTSNFSVNDDFSFYPLVMLNIFKSNRSLFLIDRTTGIYGFFYYFIFTSFVYFVYKKDRRPLILIIWFLILFLYLEFGSMGLSNYIPMHKLPRHLTVLTIPALVCLSYFILELYNLRKKIKIYRIIAIVIIIFLLVTSIYSTHQNSAYLKATTSDLKKIDEYMKDNPSKNFYIHDFSFLHMSFYNAYNNTQYETYNSKTFENLENLKGSFIVVNATRFEFEHYDPIYLPKSWILVEEIEGPKIGIYGKYNPKIYYVSEN